MGTKGRRDRNSGPEKFQVPNILITMFSVLIIVVSCVGESLSVLQIDGDSARFVYFIRL